MMRLQRYFFCLLLLLHTSVLTHAQLKNIGSLLSYKKTTNGIAGITSGGIVAVDFYNEHTVRIRATQHNAFKELPYALENTGIPAFHAFNISDAANSITISTSSVDLQIEKSPAFRVVLKNKSGKIVNEDVAGAAFGTSFLGEKLSVYKKLFADERFVGMGEALGNLDRRGSIVPLNNTDTYRYGDPRLPMYTSVPFYMGIHDSLCYGLFFNNSHKGSFNFGISTPDFVSLNLEGGDVDYFLFYDSSISKIIQHYTSLTGRMPMPPKWSLGYQQSRCTYYPQEKVEWIANTFRSKKIPIDGIVLDADYQLGYQPFRINANRFPDMPALAAKMAAMNIELTASVYPGVKMDSTYESYTDGLKKDVFIKYADGALFKTEIAPLKVLLPDYTNAKARSWWIDKMKWLPQNGIHGYWNDMNEPAVGGSYLPDNLLFDFDGRKAYSDEAKNVYGFQMARSSYESALQYNTNHRPFVLTRSGFAGVQRYSAVWSGDNTSSNEGLLSGVLLNNQMGLSGISFCGYDVGGYIGDASKDLYKRWIQLGVFSPYCRNHREFYGAAGEPWAYGEEAEAISKTYIEFRYRLMPYLYSAIHEASQKGLPLARSLCMNYPYDNKAYDANYQYQFLFGDAMMVVPVSAPEKQKKIWLPKGDWYNLYTDKKIAGDNEIWEELSAAALPVFVKASSVIPMQSLVQSTKEKPGDTLFLHIFNGAEKNTYHYYEDEGDGFAYQQGNYCEKMISFDPFERKIIIGKQTGTYASAFTFIQFVLHGFGDIKINQEGKQLSVQSADGRMIDPLYELRDIYDPAFFAAASAAMQQQMQQAFTIHNSAEEIVLSWGE